MSASLALPSAGEHHRVHITHHEQDGRAVHVVRLPWDLPLEQDLSMLQSLHELAVDRGETFRVMRGLVEIDVRDPGRDPAAVPGSYHWWVLDRVAGAAALLEVHAPSDQLDECLGCDWHPTLIDPRPSLDRQWAEHLAEVLDAAGRLTPGRWW